MADRTQRLLDQLSNPAPLAPPPAFLAGVRRIRRRRRLITVAACAGSLAALALAVVLLRPLFAEAPAPSPRPVAITTPSRPTITTAGALSLRGTTMDGATLPLSGELGTGGEQDVLRARDISRVLESIELAPRPKVADPPHSKLRRR